ncbi:TVP38/TMEM64 family protein [Chthonobacter albigriseus]|uniref:TVP38/TMEM64 family protein n=1 Tax=Chthonobacter albigriseus TaxID=1683161 RepID=UPI0015EF1067|nr:TVP38/TMEM64 family protein [Chthonobacter albigriseus]
MTPIDHDLNSSRTPTRWDTRTVLRRLAPVAAFVIFAAVAFSLGLHHQISVQGFLDRREALVAGVEANYVKALAGFVLFYTVVVALSVPGGLFLTLAAGFLFGPVVGGLAASLAATVGATILFLAARTSFGEILRERARGRIERFTCGFCENAFNYLLFLRLVPIAPFWFVNLVPALMGVKTRVFVLATAIGILPATFAFATIGAGLDSVLAAQAEAKRECLAAGTCQLTLDKHALLTPGLLAAFVALGFVALLPVAAKAYRRRRMERGK